MSIELASAYVSIVPSAKGIKSAIESELGGPLTKAAERSGADAGRAWGDKFAQNAKGLESFGKKGLAASALLAGGLAGAAKAAGSLEAAISANQQVLGEAAPAIRKWASDSVNAVGLSERAALEAATSFGQLGKIAGETGQGVSDFAIQFATLAADMAAFKDVGIDVAIADLQSGFAGSTEVLRKYGIFLDEASLKQAYFDQTGQQITGTLTAQQRVVATSAAIWAQSGEMQGQAARESEGLARQIDNAKAEFENMAATLGAAVLPAFTDLVGLAGDTVAWFGQINERSGGTIGQFAGLATAGLAAASGISFIAAKTSSAVTSMRNMSSAAFGAAAAAGVLTAAFTALQIVDTLRGNFADLSDEMNAYLAATAPDTAASTADVLNAFTGLSTAVLEADTTIGKVGDGLDVFLTRADGAEKWADAMENAFAKVLAQSPEAAQQLVDSFRLVDQSAQNGREGAVEWAESYNLTTGVIDGFQKQVDDAAGANARLNTSTGELATGTDTLGDAFRDATTRASEMLEGIRELYNEQLSQIDVQRAYERSVDDSENALSDYNAILQSSAGDHEAITDAARNTTDQMIETAKAFAESKGASLDSATGIQAMVESLYTQAVALSEGDPLRQNLLDYIAELQKIPSEIDTQIRLRVTGQTVTKGGDIIGIRAIGNEAVRSELGRYVPAGSNLLTTVAEPGAGAEAILPLANPRRLNALLSDQRIGAPVLAAMADLLSLEPNSTGGAARGPLIGEANFYNDVDVDGMFRLMQFQLAGVA